jgi:PhoH-like ATPase
VKNYVLDTNILLHDPNSLLNFQENNLVIPIEVIEEIDHFKRESSELGQNARAVSRMLDDLRTKGRLSEGVPLPNGGHLRIVLPARPKRGANGKAVLGAAGNGHTVDNRILDTALRIRKASPGCPTILVTKDINLRLKADTLGLSAEDYETDRIQLTDLYSGVFERAVTAERLQAFRVNGELELEGKYFPNEYCTLYEEGSPKRTILTKVDPSGVKLVAIHDSPSMLSSMTV